MNKIDFTKLKGEELFFYFTNEQADKDYASVVALLPYALMDMEKAYSVLELVVKENKTLVVRYPEVEGFDFDVSNMEYVGDVYDGAIYISDEPYFKERITLF